jgi:hypothetical protein
MEQRKGLISFGNFIYGVCAKNVSRMIAIFLSPGIGYKWSPQQDCGVFRGTKNLKIPLTPFFQGETSAATGSKLRGITSLKKK